MQILLQDMRYGLRMLGRNPGFTAVAVLAIALGIGVNAGIFSVLNGAALRMLPVPGAEQVVSIDQIFHGKNKRNVHGEPTLFSYSEYQEYRANNHVFSGLIAYDPFLSATLAGGRARQLYGQLTSCNYFDALNEHPSKGRGFVDSDCATAGAGAVVVLSDQLWQGAFAADANLIGKRVVLNRTAFTVIGIAPPGFGGTEPIPSSFWVPITMQGALEPDAELLGDANVSWLALLGRVKPGVSMGQVKADLTVIADSIDERHAGRKTSLAIRTATFLGRPEEHNLVLGAAAVILAGFGLVLLIACANVANLMLARATARQREMAIRLSVGAGRWRLIRQLLTESVMLAMMGGVAGSVLAFWSFEALSNFVMSHLPHGTPELALNLTPDLRVFGYALFLTAHHRGGVRTCACTAGFTGRCEHCFERRRWRIWQPRRQVAATLPGSCPSGGMHDSADCRGAADAWALLCADRQSGIHHGRNFDSEPGPENTGIQRRAGGGVGKAATGKGGWAAGRGWRCRGEADSAQRQSLGDELLRSWEARGVRRRE